MFSVQPQDSNVTEHGRVVLSCRAQAADTPVISWSVEDSDGKPQNVPNGANVTAAGDLEFVSITRSGRGVYECKACNTAGCVRTEALLTVFCK